MSINPACPSPHTNANTLDIQSTRIRFFSIPLTHLIINPLTALHLLLSRTNKMASGLLSSFALRTSTVLGVGLGLSLSLHPLSPFRASPMQCQYSAPYYRLDSQNSSESGWTLDRSDPAIAKQGRTGPRTASGILTASNMRQVSLGSVLGLVVGVGLRAFSRALVVLLGMGIVVIEWAASKGYNILPVRTIQKYVKSVDVQKAVTQHMPFKMSFGATMAMAAFAQF